MERTLSPNSRSAMQSAMPAAIAPTMTAAPPVLPGPLPPSPAASHRHRLSLLQRLMVSRLRRQVGEQGLRRHGNRFQAHGIECAPSPSVHSPTETRALSGTPPSYTCRVTTSRQPVSTTLSTTPLMTIDSCGRRVQQPKFRSVMEALVPSPARLEVTPTSEAFGTGGQEAYAASPNSLYMYEQEKHDMLTFDPINPAVPSPTLLSQADEFDLKPQFENSNTLDISNMTPTNSSFQTNGTSAQPLARDVWRGKTMTSMQDVVDTGLRMDKAELGQEPTLNELNLDDSLLDELNLESLLQNVDTSVFASGAPSPLPDSKPASGVATPLQDGCGHQTPLMTVAAVTQALDSYAGMDSSNSSSQPAAVSSKSPLSAQPSPATYTGSFMCQSIKREPYDPEYETGRPEDKTLLHRLLLQGKSQTQQQQQLQQQMQQMPLPQQSFQSQKSVPPTSTASTSSSSSSSTLPPLRFRSSQSGSFQPLSNPLPSARLPTAPRLKFSPSPSPAPTVVKQEPPPCPLNVLRGSGHVSFPPSSSNCQQQAASSRSSTRGVKRTLSSLEGEDSQNTMERKWREIEQFIHDPETAEADQEDGMQLKTRAHKKVRHASSNSTRTSSIEASSEVDTDDDDDSDNDLDSDLESLSETGESLLDDKTTGSGKKKERQYFWQYNVQAKGPKGTRLRLLIDNSNPHKVHKFEDPVFDPENTMVAGIRHGGKARKGDGNEVTPNPNKFYHIGLQIRRLNRQINDLGNANDLPAPQRNSSRKLKNKLASRACRLKKKAQHEANKVKLFGLNLEHKRMMYVLQAMEQQLVERAAGIMKRQQTGAPMDSSQRQKPLTAMLEELVQTHLAERVAGNGTDYVNSVISKVEKGDPTGGLDISKSKG